jgi:hypothetical protein
MLAGAQERKFRKYLRKGMVQIMRQGHRVLTRSDDAEYSNYLPTQGYAGYSLDLAQSSAVSISGFDGVNAVISDVHAFQALTRLVEGPVRSVADIQSAEAALKALIFHDHTALLNPSWVVDSGGVEPMIRRPAYGSSIQPFSAAQLPSLISDEVVITEHVSIVDQKVTESSWGGTRLIGQGLPTDISSYLSVNPEVGAMLASYPSEFRLPAYFADPMIEEHFSSSGTFSDKFYRTVGATIIERSSIIPGSTVEVRLPLLVWILLGRINNRNEIPDEIVALRDELNEARRELSELDSRMLSAGREAERADIAKYYIEAFGRVVDASGQSNFTRVKHVIYQIVEWSLLGLPAKAMQAFNPSWQPRQPQTFVRRSVAAKAFSELLDLENTSSLRSLFTPSEQEAIWRKG